MGLFDRKTRRRKGTKASSSKEKSESDAPKLGPVSTVLTESRGESSKESNPDDIVQRRFGPTETEAENMKKDKLPPARRSKHKKNEQKSAEVSPLMEFSETSKLDSPELEVDPMAHIGSSTTITGDIVAEEDLEILGTVEGTVLLVNHRVSVGEGGVVKGQVQSGSVVVNGRVEGDVEATDVVEVRSGGYVGGNVKGPRVILHDGAILIGGLDMSAALTGAADRAAKRTAETAKDQPPVIEPKKPKQIHTSAEPTKPTLKRVEVLPPEKAKVRR